MLIGEELHPLGRGTCSSQKRYLSCEQVQYTRPGDLVFDPFAGFDTTLRVAEAMGRRIGGIEANEERCAYIRSQLMTPDALICGDARLLSTYDLPPIVFSMTSPPYLRHTDPNPFTASTTPGRGYDAYLTDLHDIYRQLAAHLTDTAVAVVEVVNMKEAHGAVPFARDIARTIDAVIPFRGEVVIGWDDHYGYGYDHSYCLTSSRMLW